MNVTGRIGRSVGTVAAAAALAVLNIPGAQAAVPLTRIIQDPFTNGTSQHQTVVEPDTFAFGATVVAAAQSGRFRDGGASDIGYATSTDSGATWTQGTLPGITVAGGGGTFERVSDPSVAYDAAHGVWLISSIPITNAVTVPNVYVSRSTDGGLTFGNPVTVASGSTSFDKNWTVCDNTPTSPFYGHCYTQFDDNADGDRLKVSTSADGGLTWGPARNTGNNAFGLGGQPVVQPNGTVIIPAANANETAIIAWRSTDGGASWSSTVTIAAVTDHRPAANLRSGPLPSAEIDGAGRVYVAWQDCRFRRGCKSNDIVYSTSTDGLSWSAVRRVPIDATTSSVDHFIPGLGVDPATSGATARLGLTYYFYRNTSCGRRASNPCRLEVGYIQSNDGGTTWSNHTDVAGPFDVALTPDTTQGRMVGDYISTSWVGGRAYGAFAVAQAPSGGFAFDQAIYVPVGGLTAAAGGFVNTASGEHPVAAAASDHASPRSAVRSR
ncbi:MAG TPA: sialidase family protein [Dermatophilaceae bacterium]|nr:sialidase family protein [Dermatophilaceae bacterium]